MKEFNVIRIEKGGLSVNGFGNHKLWEKAAVISDFISPWHDEEITPIEFRALWDTEKFFFQFKVKDTSIYIDKTDNSFNSIGNSDRVELFFRKDKEMSPYYCLEIDPTPRLMDFKAFPNRRFQFDWNFSKENLLIESSMNDNGFILEGAIPIDYLKKMNLIHNNSMEVGVFRAKYTERQKGVFEPIWITWIAPESETPNFHTPSSFGVFHLL